jgi:hypothetical protein
MQRFSAERYGASRLASDGGELPVDGLAVSRRTLADLSVVITAMGADT